MIVIDTTVWIDHLRDVGTPQVTILRQILNKRSARVVVGDLVLTEVLQGVGAERDATLVEAALRRCKIVSMVGPEVAVRAAANYRALRQLGITVRRTIDMLIGTFCIESALPLLHSDRDFDHLERHLGLAVVR